MHFLLRWAEERTQLYSPPLSSGAGRALDDRFASYDDPCAQLVDPVARRAQELPFPAPTTIHSSSARRTEALPLAALSTPDYQRNSTMSHSHTTTMKAVVYSKPFEVVVSDVPIPQILSPNDVIVKVRPSSHTSSYSSSSRV